MISLRRACALGVLLALSSCSSDSDAPKTDPDAAPDLRNVIYLGGTTDEALERMVDATVKDDAAQYVLVDAPDLNQPLAADTPVTFEYHLASQAALRAPRAPAGPVAPPAWQRPLREVLKLLGPPRIAYAHGAPFNGNGYFLEFHDADDESLLQVFTGNASYAPDADAWQTLVKARQPLTLEITSAFFENNDVTSDGGPYRGGSFDLSIE